MAIQLIDYADKANGATGATGQISSADINQIKSKANTALSFLNALSGLFTLDSNGLPTAVKNSALPDINIFDKFSSDFVVSNGLIALSGGASLPIPPPLTSGVIDDTANTFTGTLPNGYSATDVERTFDGGTTWAAIVSLPLSVGNTAYAIGQVGLRIKATSERQHSTTLFNATAFTVSGGSGGSIDDGFTAVGTFTLDADITQSSNNLSWTHTSGNDNRFWSADTLKVATGTPFEFRFTIDPTKSTGYVGASQFGVGYKFAKIQWVRNSDTHGQFLTVFNNSSYQASPGVDITVPARGRIKGDGTNMTMDYSLDGGSTWSTIDTATQPAQQIQLRGEFVYFNSQNTLGINNIIQKGMVAA